MMNIEIKMAGGVYEDGKVHSEDLPTFMKFLNNIPGDFFIMVKTKGPVLVNKANILSLRPK